MSPLDDRIEAWKHDDEQIELESNLAHAFEEDVVAFLAGTMSGREKKRIRSMIENKADLPAPLRREYHWLLASTRGKLKIGGFRNFEFIRMAECETWLYKAVCLTKKEVKTSLGVRKRIWKYYARRIYQHRATRLGLLGLGYAAVLGILLLKAHAEQIYMIPVFGLTLVPLYVVLFLYAKYLW